MCDDCEWEDALNLVEKIEEEAECVPERGEDFAASVLDKAKAIGATIDEREHVTEAQMDALKNMLSGLERWTRNA